MDHQKCTNTECLVFQRVYCLIECNGMISVRYSLYMSLHELWRSYMQDLLQIGTQKGWDIYSCSVRENIDAKFSTLAELQMNQKITKADLHGCLLRGKYISSSCVSDHHNLCFLSLTHALDAVDKSKCPSYVGVRGIVLQETQNTFKLITSSDRLKSEWITHDPPAI